MKYIWLLLITTSLWAQAGGKESGMLNQTDPILPQIWLPTTYNSTNFPTLVPTPSAIITVCASGCTYTTVQAAVNAASCDDEIQVEAFDAHGFVTNLPARPTSGDTITMQFKNCAAGHWIKITSSEESSIPAQGSESLTCPTGNGETFPCTINPSVAGHMWRVVKTCSSTQTFDTAFGYCGNLTTDNGCNGTTATSGVIVTGLDFQWAPGGFCYDANFLGDNNNDTVPPSRIIFDRDMWRSASGVFDTRIMAIWSSTANKIAVVDNYINYNWIKNSDGGFGQSQTFLTASGGHVGKYVGNFDCGAPTENFMIGGFAPSAVEGWPTDWEIRNNVFCKQKSIMGPPGGSGANNALVSDEIEVKQGGQRVMIWGNYFLYSYNDAPYYTGQGSLISLKIDQNGLCPQCSVSDFDVEYNYGSHHNLLPSVFGHSTNNPYPNYPSITRMRVANNMFTDLSYTTYSNEGNHVSGIPFASGGGPVGLPNNNAPGPYQFRYDHNGIASTPSSNNFLTYINNPPVPGCLNSPFWGTRVPAFTFTNNWIVVDNPNLNGDCSNSTAYFISAGVFPQATLNNNVFVGWTGSPASQWAPYNPGVYVTGSPETPSTVNGSLGIANYAACAAGNDVPSGWATDCAITGTYVGDQPNIPMIQTVMGWGNDQIINGISRNPF